MAETKYTLSRDAAYSLPVSAVDKLLASADPAAAMIYLYLTRYGSFSEENGPKIGLTPALVRRGMDTLRRLELIAPSSPGVKSEEKLPPPQEIPDYTAEEISRRSQADGDFSRLVGEAQRLLGHILSTSELKILFGIYDYLALPTEVIALLIHHCIEYSRERFGPGRMPSMRSIEKTAYIWANREITSFDRAEEYLRELSRRKSLTEKVKAALQIRGRELSATEQKYVDSWLDMGFSPEALAIAYDRTVVQTGSLQWKYMNSIVSSWHSKGLHTPQEIEKGDGRPAPVGKKTAEPVSTPSGSDLERMEKLLGLK